MSWCDDSMINGLYTQINTYRAQNGAAPLSMSTLGMKDAEIRATQFAQYMATANPSSPTFNPHQGYDTVAASLGYDIISENLAYLNGDPNQIVNAIWQDSLHRAAMLSSSANVDGVSCVYYNGFPYWTYEPGYCSGGACGTSTTTPNTTPNTTTPSGSTGASGTPTLDSEEWAFLTLINNFRAQNGLGALQVDVELENSSRWMSNDMATNNYFSHTDSLGRSAGARIAAFGYTYSPWGENLAAGFSDAQSAFSGLQNACDADASGTCTYAHRANMLGGGYTAIGIARVYGGGSSYGWYWTTDFGGVVEQAISQSGSTTTQPPTISSFTANPTSITAGQSATLSWNVSGATSVSISGIGTVASSGSTSVSPSLSTTYTLIANNGVGNSSSAQVTITVSAGTVSSVPTITSFTATPSTVTSGQSATLFWSVSGATSVSIYGVGTVASSGSVAVTPRATTTYTLTATNNAGTAIAPATVTVSAGTVGTVPTITSFTASPSSITSGQSATLSWNVSGATSVSISGIGTVGSTGSQSVIPAQTTTYTLTALNNTGSANASATVSVTAAITTPATPSLTSAVPKGQAEVDLAWAAGSGGGTVASYRVLRNGSQIATVSATTASYADTGLTAGTTYSYTVQAVGTSGALSGISNSVQATTQASTPSSNLSCAAPASNAFTGCYYGNTTLSGNPVLVRTDNQITFDWGFSSPNPAVPAGPYSVRWQGNFTFGDGNYTFTAMTSDGMRLYIDGAMVLNRWYDQSAYIYNVRQTISQGTHLITVEYYENTGWSTAHLTWQNNTPASQPPSILSFTASPTTVTPGQMSALSWSVNGASSITIDHNVGDVTSGTTARISPTGTTTYTLTASNSAGSSTAQVTVAVSSQNDTQPPTAPALSSANAAGSTEVDLVWSASADNVGVAGYQILRNGSALTSVSGTTLSYADKSAAPNTSYTYTVRAFDGAGNYSNPSNAIQATTPSGSTSGGTCSGAASGAFTGCYYNNLSMSGSPALSRTDSAINFDWGTASPASGVAATNFSARWQGYFTFNDATYSFATTASDGIRVYIDGQLIIDHWQDEPPSMYQVRPTISAGQHLVTVEYYAHSGWASCHVTWQQH